MKVGEFIKECQEHGMSIHASYKNKAGYVYDRCLSCAREYQQKRRSDPAKRSMDREYTDKWNKAHPDLRRRYVERYRDARAKARADAADKMFDERYDTIIEILEACEFIFEPDQALGICADKGISDIKSLADMCQSRAAQAIARWETGRASSIVKHERGVQHTYSSLDDARKDKIRREYKRMAQPNINRRIRNMNNKLKSIIPSWKDKTR